MMDQQRLSLRKAYGEALIELGRENRDVVVLEADLGKSTMSHMFQEVYPERYFEMGIAEQNMLSTAAGLAASGKIPFASSFAVFASGRAYDQIRQTISIGRLNVNICGSSSGLSDVGDGATHQCIEDISLMNGIPGMTVFTPCDAIETRKAVFAAAQIDGPTYIRVVRNELPVYTKEDDDYQVGKLRVIKEGSDVAIFTHGLMLEQSMKAAEELENEGISTMVVNVATIKPFDSETAIRIARSVKAVISAEDHSLYGGLTSILAMTLRKERTPIDYVAIEDEFGQSAITATELLNHYGLNSKSIVNKAKLLLSLH